MEEQISQVIAAYLKTPASQLNPETRIGRAALGSSILLHRMYAKLAEQGIVVDDYSRIETIADLLQAMGGNRQNGEQPVRQAAAGVASGHEDGEDRGIGIDMEEIAAMPRTNDFREDAFYAMNFTPTELAYGTLQTDPYATFAGLFALKEAIVKADNQYKDTSFNKIFIGHTEKGKPVHPGFQLSVSHTPTHAVGVALHEANRQAATTAAVTGPAKKNELNLWLVLFSFLLSVLAILMVLRR